MQHDLATEPVHIAGPLKSWYDIHEALAHEVSGLAATAASIDAATVDAFVERFIAFDNELRNHSEVEDAIMFPAIERSGGRVDQALSAQHHGEQQLAYDARCALLAAKVEPGAEQLAAVTTVLADLRDGLLPHLRAEETDVLPQIPQLFDLAEQAALLTTIITSLPADPTMQPWIAAALTPEHRTARLRNMAAALPPDALRGVMGQIHRGVDVAVWADIAERTPQLAALAL
jgi:iron-sulfur cluster repair protein YtfE (RIC family)